MKKILLSLFALGMTTTTALSVVSCGDRTHNRDFSKTNLQIYSNSEFSHIGIIGHEGLETGSQELFEWNVARAFENDVHLPIVADDFEFIYFNEKQEAIDVKNVDFNIGSQVVFRVRAKATSTNFESETQVIHSILMKDDLKKLDSIVQQKFLKSFAPDIKNPEAIYLMIKRFNNNVIANARNMEIVSITEPVDGEFGKIIVKGASTSFHYDDSEVEFTFSN